MMSYENSFQLEELCSRSTQDVFQDHLQRRQQQALEEDLATNYATDVVVFCAHGLHYGHNGVRQTASLLRGYLSDATFNYGVRLVSGEIAYLEWSAHSHGKVVQDGADSFLIRHGQIVAQTIHYTVHDDT